MNCQEFEIYLSAYLDNELTPQENKSLREHLETCEQCREELKEFEMMRDRIDELPAFTGEINSEEIWRNISDSVNSTQTIAFPLWKKFGSIAAILALTATVIFFTKELPQTEPVKTASIVEAKALPLSVEEEFAGQMLESLIINDGKTLSCEETIENIYAQKISEQLLGENL